MFREKILDESKKQTIRRLRKHPIKVGDLLHLYFGLRTKHCKKLGEATCTETFFIQMTASNIIRSNEHPLAVMREETKLTYPEVTDLAKRDGFHNYVEMLSWFLDQHTLPAWFQVIRWKKLERI